MSQLDNHKPTFKTQALAFILTHCLLFLIAASVLVPLLGLFYFPTIVGPYIILPYITYIALTRHELKDGNPWIMFSESFPYFSVLRNHIGFEVAPLHKDLIEAEKAQNAQFVIACFPHGCASDFRVLMQGMLPTFFPNIHSKCRTLAASVLFKIPLVREISLWTGCIDASRKVAEKALDAGRSIIVLPGGEAEQIRTCQGEERVYIRKRKGFIKLAMRKKTPVVPVYVFGSSDLYETSETFYNTRLWLMEHFWICLTMHSGMWKSQCPLPVKNTIVMGKPLTFELKGDQPTAEELDVAHETFCKALQTLFDENKGKYGYGGRTLEML